MTWTPSLTEVVPVLDALRVALADEEHDRGGVGRAVVRQALLPVGREQRCPSSAMRVDVAGESERHHVGLEAVDHGAGLLARAAVRLLDGDVLAGLSLPMLRERGIEFLIELAGRIVGDVEELGGISRCRKTGEADRRQRKRGSGAVKSGNDGSSRRTEPAGSGGLAATNEEEMLSL